MLAGNRRFGLMACCALSCLMALGTGHAAPSSAPGQQPGFAAGQVMPASEAEIAARIERLQIEREQRLAALLPRVTEQGQETGSSLLQDRQTWILILSVLLGLSMLCLIWLFWLTRRARQGEGQSEQIAQWQQERGKKRGQKRADQAVNSQQARQAFDLSSGFGQAHAGSATAAGTINYTAPESTWPASQLTDGEPAISVVEETEPYRQAQFWVALGKQEMAIDILEQSREHDVSPHSWLLLFELYRQIGARERYEALRQHCQSIFNAHIPDWEEAMDNIPSLKDRPDLMQRINRALLDHNVVAYLEGLLFDNRGGTRYGFEFGVYRDLVRLFDAVCAGKDVNNCEIIVQ